MVDLMIYTSLSCDVSLWHCHETAAKSVQFHGIVIYWSKNNRFSVYEPKWLPLTP